MNTKNIYEYKKHINDIKIQKKKGSNFITDCAWLNCSISVYIFLLCNQSFNYFRFYYIISIP